MLCIVTFGRSNQCKMVVRYVSSRKVKGRKSLNYSAGLVFLCLDVSTLVLKACRTLELN